MKKPYSFFLFSLLLTVLCLQQVHSQTTRTVGSGGNYTTLKGAFDAINAGTITGTIILHIISNTTETATAVLNASGTGSANYSAVAIYPTGTGGWTITGSLTAPIINLNGADNVTIDGRVNQTGSTKSLTIANTNTGGAVIQLIADATANTIRYCIVRGVTISATSGVIIFSTGTSTGNDNNTIEYCDIRDEATTPTNAIYSAGSSVAVDNSGISITTCNIFNFFAAAAASNGIFIASNSSAWTITGNRFFQAATRTATTGATHRVINIVTASGVNYTVSNNIIGFANEAGTGVTTYTGAVANLYRAIELITGTATASSIQGNTISAITLSTTSNSTTLPGIFSGISILAGSVNVGTTTSNTLGATTGNGAIQITTSTTTPVITGIYATTTGTVAIQNNNIGAISTGGGADIGYTFHGINTAGTGGNITITANTIGSTSTDNSINVGTSGTTTTGVCTFNGINNAATGAISIDNNTVQNCSAFGTAASIFRGILNSGGSGTLNISSNNIIAGTNTGTGAFAPISNSAVPLTLNINDNIIRNHSKTAATGTFTAIDNSGAVTTAININNNQLGNTDGGLLIYAAANSATLLGISNTTGATGCALSIQNNDIRGIVHSVAGTNDHTYIINSAATLSKNISSNTFTNLSVNTTGAIIFISNNVVMPANGVQNVNSNSIVTAFTRTAASGAITLFTSTLSTANTSVTVNNNGNNFSNITISGTATILGWINTDAGTTSPVKTIDGNTFSNWTGGTGAITAMNVNITSANNAIRNNNINTISSSGAITGITTAAGNDNIFSNTIHTLVSTGATTNVTGIAITAGTTKNIYLNEIYNLQANNITTGSVNGIAIETSTTNNVYRNRIYDLSSSSPGITTGTVSGILVASGTTHNIYNNRIANLSTSAANVANPLRGINVTSTTANSTINVYYNSIFLNATSSGTTFGSSGVFHTYVNSTTSAVLNLRNNIIVNTSTPKGTGITAAFRRSAATNLKNYATTSNNNLLFAGVPSSTRAIFVEGTTVWQTLAAFKTQVTPRETNSITESPPFLSTSGSDANFLKISTFAGTLIESGAVNIATYTTDFEGDIRAGNPGYPAQQNGFGTAPDIGADEFDGTMIQKELQSITYNQASTSTVLQGAPNQEILRLDFAVTGNSGTLNLNSIVVNSLNVSDDDVTGVKLYRTNTTTFSTANLLGSTTFIGGNATFLSLGYDLPAGTTYIWVAYDVSPTAIINNTLDAQIQANQINVAGSTYPTTNQSPAGSRTIKGPLAGIYTVGSTNCDYTTITAAISDLNILGLSANVTFMLNDATYPSESFPLIINVTNANIPSETKTVTIRPAESATVTISGPSANSQIFRILNSYIIIDGSNSGGSGRNLTIENTNATTPQVIRIGSTGTTAIVGVTIKNCIIINGVNTSTALVVYGADGAAGYFNNITIQNNSIQKTYIGIFFNGVVATGNGSGTLITQNDLNTSGANSIRLVGVYVQGVDGATVSNNTIGNISNSNAESVRAIWFATGTNSGTISWNTISNITLTNTGAFAVSGIYVTSATVTSLSIANNTISTLANSGTSLSYGIILTFSPNTNITNNVVSGITQNGAAAFWGIVQSGAVNSICSENTVSGLTTSTTGVANGINIQGASTGVTISRNKVFNIKNTNSLGYTAVGLALASTSTTANITASNNLIYDIAGYGYASQTTDNGYGINIYSGGGYKLYYNSVNMATNQTLATGVPACLIINSAVETANSIDIRNNIFSIPATLGTNRYAVLCNAANSVFSEINYNDYFTSGTNLGYIGATNRANLDAWKAGTGKDGNSRSDNPLFTAADNLILQPGSPLRAKATPVAVTIDYTGAERDAEFPTIGAYELPPIFTWTGTTSTAWATASNWTPGLPGSTRSPVIPQTTNQPIIEGAVTVNGLTINVNAVLTIANTGNLTVTGTLSNNAGNAGLVIKSDATGTGSLLNNTNNVGASFQRYVRGFPEAWHLLSSPVAAQAISGDFIPSGTYGDSTGYDFYHWHEPDTSWIYFNHPATWAATHGNNNFHIGRGYLVSYQATNPTKAFAGSLNNGSQSRSITKTKDTSEEFGFNLVGNPYPSSVDWKAATGWTRTDLDDSEGGYDIWIWNDAEDNYGVYNSSSTSDEGTLGVTRYIAPTQGFFVKAAQTGSLGFANSLRVHQGASNWLKSAKTLSHILMLEVKSPNTRGSDEAMIEFGHVAPDGGALKKFSFVKTAPSLYFPKNGQNYSMQLLGETANYPVIPLSFKAGANGQYTLMGIFDHGYFEIVELLDKQTGLRQNMKTNPEYTFQASTKDNPGRFVLQFVPGHYANPHDALPARIFAYQNVLTIDLRLLEGAYTFDLYDITGRKLRQETLQGGQSHELDIPVRGMFIVRINGTGGTMSKKILLN